MIDVTDFGADKTGTKDSSFAIVEAIAEAKRLSDAGEEVVVSFPKGRYDFYPEHSFEKRLYISNTTYSEAFLDKKIAIRIEDMKNVTVDGGGSLFMLHGRMGGFFAIHSENVTFKNFTIDMQVPTVIDVTIEESAGEHSVIAHIPECYVYEVREKDIVFYGDNSPYTEKPYWELTHSTFAPRTQKRDLATGVTRRIMEKMLLTNATSVEKLENHRVRITYAAASDAPAPGTVIQMRRNDRDVTGAYFWDCKNVVARNIDVGFMHGFGICAQTTENITLEGVRFKTLPGKGTFSTCTADQVHLVSCYGDIIINNCYFENPHDDPINVHGHHMLVSEISDDRRQVRIKAMHGSPYGVA
ncbi:MAG: right-handed parallel beta-helix repeat-containing protein, partial [Clostridia bacterium]|nr:right-handed parallel beta-helix repeat-containing protein [Clostridia bacterium]